MLPGVESTIVNPIGNLLVSANGHISFLHFHLPCHCIFTHLFLLILRYNDISSNYWVEILTMPHLCSIRLPIVWCADSGLIEF